MKNECNRNIIRESTALRAKMYSVKIDRVDKEIKKIKCVKDSVTTRLRINDFRKSLLVKRLYHDSMYVCRPKIHRVYTHYIRKLTLSYFDDKRFILVCKNKVNTYTGGIIK